jgi:hypothetical protein
MGLDMYLKASKYVAGYSFSQDQDKSTYAALLKAAGLELVDVDENTPSAQFRTVLRVKMIVALCM